MKRHLPSVFMCAVFLLMAGLPAQGRDAGAGAGDDERRARHFSILKTMARHVSSLERSASLGDPHAQYALATLYAEGAGHIRRDMRRSLFYMKRAAEQGLLDAQMELGVLYATGEGVPQSYRDAEIWLRRAALQGEVSAQYNLGVIHSRGLSGKRDGQKAARWWRLAASRGNVAAQLGLAVLYQRGEGVPRDLRKARRWLHLAAVQNHPEAQYLLGAAWRDGVGGAASDEKARLWFRRAALNGDSRAQYALGSLYAKDAARKAGQGRVSLLREAYIWFSLASRAGHDQAARGRRRAARGLSPKIREQADRVVLHTRIEDGALEDEGGGAAREALARIQAFRADIRRVDPRTLLISGPLGTRTPRLIEEALEMDPAINSLALDSPGGLLASGLALADIVRSRGLIVRAEKQCNSACTFALFASPRPTANSDSVIGFHRAAPIEGGEEGGSDGGSVRGDINAERAEWLLRSHYAWSGFPQALIDVILATPNDKVHVFSKAELIYNNLLAVVRDPISGREISARDWCERRWDQCHMRPLLWADERMAGRF